MLGEDCGGLKALSFDQSLVPIFLALTCGCYHRTDDPLSHITADPEDCSVCNDPISDIVNNNLEDASSECNDPHDDHEQDTSEDVSERVDACDEVESRVGYMSPTNDCLANPWL